MVLSIIYRLLIVYDVVLFCCAPRRLNETKSQGVYSQSAEELLNKLQNEVREMSHRKDSVESTLTQRLGYMEKLQGFDSGDRNATEVGCVHATLLLVNRGDGVCGCCVV